MAADTSEQVLLLLQELSTLRKMEINSEGEPAESAREENRLRQERKQEIIQEIKALAEQKKEDDQTIRGNSETESKSPEEKRGL